MIKICQFCGVEFKTSKKKAKFCSAKCMGMAKRKTVPQINCLICGKLIPQNNKERKYCSQECYHKSKYKKNEIEIFENVAHIIVQHKKFGELKYLIDIEDLEKVKDFCWYADRDKYAQSRIGKLHNIILPHGENLITDHINNNPLDNRKCNLRVVTTRGNCFNRVLSKKNKTGVAGVCFKKSENVYEVYYGRKYCGRFKTLEEAKSKRLEMERLDKEHLNFAGEMLRKTFKELL